MRNNLLLVLVGLFGLAISCKQPTTTPETMEEEMVIVKLTDSASPQQLEIAFSSQQLKVVKRLGAKSSFYLCKFDTRLLEPDSMVVLLKKSDLVNEAQRDRNLSTRKN